MIIPAHRKKETVDAIPRSRLDRHPDQYLRYNRAGGAGDPAASIISKRR